jgi:site-specific DNA-methyltransferase (adenine-specific)
MSASNPVLRDYHEYILIFSKESYSKNNAQEKRDTIEHDDFIQWTKSIWTFPAVNAKKIGHPAPFPIELPHRLINLYSYEGDVVLDPFIGSGTTAIAAIKNNRYYIGYDIKKEYIDLAESRLSNQKFI